MEFDKKFSNKFCLGLKSDFIASDVDEALYGQIEAASRSEALVLTGHFNHLNICWREILQGICNPRSSEGSCNG